MFKASNNEVEYEALIELCHTGRVDSIKAYSDSQLVISRLNGDYKFKDDTMAAYVRRVHEATRLLKHFLITHIPRFGNC